MIPYFSSVLTGLVEALFSRHFEGVAPDKPLVLDLSCSGPDRDSPSADAAAAHYALIHDLFIKNGTAALVETALESGLLSLKGNPELVERFRKDLKYFADFARFRELRAKMVLQQLEKVLQKKQVPYVILKGMAMKADGYYPEAWLRMSSDIDFLVPKKLVFDVAKHLLDHGFELSLNKMFNLLDYTWQRNAEGFVFTKDQVSLELHHSLHENAYLKWDDMHIWPGSSQGANGGVLEAAEGSRYRFSREMLLMHLLTHYYKHILGLYLSAEAPGHKFIWIIDLYAILRDASPDFDWQHFKSLAAGPLNCYGICLFVLGLTLYFFPVLRERVPAEILADLEMEKALNETAFGFRDEDYAHLIRPDATGSEALLRKMQHQGMHRWPRLQRILYKSTILFPPVRTLQVEYNYWGGVKLPLLYADHLKGMLLQRLKKQRKT